MDERPVLVCRFDIPPQMQTDVDGWMPKHFDDSFAHPAVSLAVSYGVVHDYEVPGGLPAMFNGQCNRFVVYVLDDIAGMLDWIDSPHMRQAIEDSREAEAQLPMLEGEPFVGNIYETTEVQGAVGRGLVGEGPITAERFEVGDADAGEFDAWLNGPYLEAVAFWPGIARVRTWKQKRDVPERFPFTRYLGKGNRMIWAEFEEGVDVGKTLADANVRETLAGSVRWDVRLPYVRRDAAENLLIRHRRSPRSDRDAQSTAGGG